MSNNSDERIPSFYGGGAAPKRGTEDRSPSFYDRTVAQRGGREEHVERTPSFYDGQDRGAAAKRGTEDRSPSFYDGQDWTHVTIRGKPKPASQSQGGGPVPKYNSQAAHLRKIEQAEGPLKLKQLSSESKQMIIAKRVANGWNQQRLNQECQFPANTIRDIENGKSTPTPGQLNVLNRVLKVGLKYE